jgi:cytochrome bd-type quinol oxidase subunit 2
MKLDRIEAHRIVTDVRPPMDLSFSLLCVVAAVIAAAAAGLAVVLYVTHRFGLAVTIAVAAQSIGWSAISVMAATESTLLGHRGDPDPSQPFLPALIQLIVFVVFASLFMLGFQHKADHKNAPNWTPFFIITGYSVLIGGVALSAFIPSLPNEALQTLAYATITLVAYAFLVISIVKYSKARELALSEKIS